MLLVCSGSTGNRSLGLFHGWGHTTWLLGCTEGIRGCILGPLFSIRNSGDTRSALMSEVIKSRQHWWVWSCSIFRVYTWMCLSPKEKSLFYFSPPPIQPRLFQTHPLYNSLSTFPLDIHSIKSSHSNNDSFSSLLLRVNFRLSAVWYVHHWGSEQSREQRWRVSR